MELATRELRCGRLRGWATGQRRLCWRWRLAALLWLVIASELGAAENCFPRGKSVTFIIAYPIGTLDNIYGRMIKTVAEDAIGSQFTPKNIPGKGAIEGITTLYNARPSGRTLGMFNSADLIVAELAGAVPFEIAQFSIFGRIVDTPRAVYVSKSAHARGITTIEDAIQVRKTLRWGITSPSNFFASAILNHLFGIKGEFVRIRGSVLDAAKAVQRENVELLVLEVGAAKTVPGSELIPILALGPKVPNERVFQKYKVPMLGRLIKGRDHDQALSMARITASGLLVAGPPHIPGMRGKCVELGFKKALKGSNLRAMARIAKKPIAPLDGEAATKLIRKVTPDGALFKSIWVEALKSLKQ